MTEVPDIMRATFKRDEKTYFYVDQPTVYKSDTQDIYVVFGTVRVDNGETSNFLQQAAAQKFQAPEETEAAPAAVFEQYRECRWGSGPECGSCCRGSR